MFNQGRKWYYLGCLISKQIFFNYFSDLRLRINEKRIDSHVRPDEKEHIHSSRRYDAERERPSRSHHSSPPREKRRTGKKIHSSKKNPIFKHCINV